MHILERQQQIIPIFTDLGTLTDLTFLDELIKLFILFFRIGSLFGCRDCPSSSGRLNERATQSVARFPVLNLPWQLIQKSYVVFIIIIYCEKWSSLSIQLP
jgi:hypothetical protein